MFDQKNLGTKSALWKFLPLALLIFAGLVALVIYLERHQRVELEELTAVLHAEDPDFGWYQKYVELRDPKIQMGLNFAGNRVLMVSGVVENGGERTLDVVEMKIVFYNFEQPVAETTKAPIRPSPYTPALPPLTKRGFGFYIEDLPHGWQSGHAEVSISGFRFSGAGQN